MKIIISAGGTGGHIFPAVAVADELKRQDPSVEILFIGAEGRMEMERVPKAGYTIIGLPIAGFQRQLSLENIIKNIQLLYKLPLSMWRVRRIVKSFKPDVAVGFGGFASGPTLRTAANFGIPTILQEQNGFAGVTNKLLAEKAVAICVAYKGMEAFFPKDTLHLTGNPVRSDIVNVKAKRDAGITHFRLDKNKKTIVIMGGSLGAKALNSAVETNAQLIENHKDVQIIWQCGRLYEEQYKNGKAATLPHVQMKAFLDKMDLVYAVADVIIARSGALTVSELCLAGTPSVLVPSPNVAEDHQTKNAMALVEQGAAILVRNDEAETKMLQTAYDLLKNEGQLATLSRNILTLAKPNAARDIVQIIKEKAR